MKVVGLGINREIDGNERYVIAIEYSKECNLMLIFVRSSWKFGIDIHLHCQCSCACGNTWSDYCDVTTRIAEIYVSFGESVRIGILPITFNRYYKVGEDLKTIVERFLDEVKNVISRYETRDEVEAYTKKKIVEFIDNMIEILNKYE